MKTTTLLGRKKFGLEYFYLIYETVFFVPAIFSLFIVHEYWIGQNICATCIFWTSVHMDLKKKNPLDLNLQIMVRYAKFCSC